MTSHTSSALRGAFFMGASMIKRFFLTLALAAGLFSPAHSAGTIGFSLTQRFDKVTTKPLNGGKLYFIQAGTTSTPQNAFQDSALTIPWPNPLTLDAGGNVPQLFFADGQIKVRLTNASGVEQIVADNILVVGASSGGGGGGTVDPTTVIATGDIKARYGTGVLTGFVRANGRTIGSATSGATERANADAQALFEYLWNTDGALVVSTGRGGSANADWVANKTLTLPDARGRVFAGLNDMGGANSSVISGTTMTRGDTITLGSTMGVSDYALVASQIPGHSHGFSGTTGDDFPDHSHGTAVPTLAGTTAAGGAGVYYAPAAANTAGASTRHRHAFSGLTDNGTPGGGSHQIMQPTMLLTFYQKL